MDADGGENQSALFDLFQDSVALVGGFEEAGHIDVRRAGIGASAKLDGLDTFGHDEVEGFFERFVAKQSGKDSDFHVLTISSPKRAFSAEWLLCCCVGTVPFQHFSNEIDISRRNL